MLYVLWFTTQMMAGLMAFNRYISICRNSSTFLEYSKLVTVVYRRLFDGKRTYWWCAGTWIIGLVTALPVFHACCPVYLVPSFYTWTWGEGDGSLIMSQFELAFMIVVCCIIFVLKFLN